MIYDYGKSYYVLSYKVLYMLSASETENIEQVIIEQSNFKSPENVWIQMFHRWSLSVFLKSKKLFGEGDVGYAMWVMGKFLRLGKFSMREIVKGDNL